MGGIPLAALSVRPPEQGPNPLQQYAQAIQIQGQQQQQQMGAVQLQQAKQTQQDQQTVRKAFMDSNGDLDQAIKLSAQRGVSPAMLTQLQQHALDVKTKLQSLQTEQLKNMATQNDNARGLIQPIVSAPPEKQAEMYAAARQTALQNPQAYGITDPNQIPEQFPGADALKTQIALHQGGAAQAAQAIKEREVTAAEQTAQSRVTGANTASQRLQAEMPGGAMQPVEQKELSAYQAGNPGKTPVDFMKFKASLAPQAQIAVQGGAVGDGLAQSVASGNMKISDVLTARTPLPIRKQFLNQVLAINPQYKSFDFDIEKGVAKDFTSGKSAQNLTAFNTAIDHAKQLDKAIDQLNNGNVTPFNDLGNTLGAKLGNDATTNFNVIKNALSGEISKVFKGGQATDAEIHAVQAPFDSANSPQQLRGAIRQAVFLMNSKRNALQEQYSKGSKAQPNFGGDQQTPTSGMIQARDPQGKLHQAPAGTALPAGWKLEQ